MPEAPVLPSLELLAPVLQAISYKDQWLQCKHQWYSYSAISSVCYGVSAMSHGHKSTVFCVLFPKISTGQKNQHRLDGTVGTFLQLCTRSGKKSLLMIETELSTITETVKLTA